MAFLGLLGSMARTAIAQSVDRMPQNRTLDAQFPSAHAYIIEVWFSPQNKPATFKARVFDPSIPGDYDRQAWEAYRTKMNAPGSGWVSRRVDFTTRQGNRPTEREQIKERVKQERDKLEFQDIKPVDVKPHPSEQPKATTKFSYKDISGTKWVDPDGVVWLFDNKPSENYRPKDAKLSKASAVYTVGNNGQLFQNGKQVHIGVWTQDGGKITINSIIFNGDFEYSRSGKLSGDVIMMDPYQIPNGPSVGSEKWSSFK